MMRLNLEVLGSKYTKAAAFFLLSLCWILSGEVLSAQQQVLIREIIIESVQSDSAAIQEWRSLEGKQILGVKELNHTSTKGIGDAIRQLPGVTLQGPPLVYRNASIMGLDKEFQTILIDGIRPAGGEDRREYKLDRIPTALIESVEYVNNPGVSWGSNAAVGLINIKVKEVPERLTQAVNISLDATSTYSGVYPHLNYFAGNTRGKWGYMFYADYSHHNRIDETQLSDTAMGLNGTSEEFGRISLTTLAGKLKYSPSGRQNFVFDFTSSSQTEQEDLLADITRRSQGGLNFSQDSAVEVAQRQLYSAKLTHRYHKSHLETESRFIGDYSVLKKHKDRLREKDTGFETSLESEDQNLYLLGLYSDWKYSCNTGRQGASSVLKWGIEMDHNRRIFDRFVFAKQADHLFWDDVLDGSYDLSINHVGAYLEQELVFNDATALLMGGRVERDDYRYVVTDTNGQAEFWKLLPSAHLRHEFRKGGPVLRASVTRQTTEQPYLYLVPVSKVKHKKEIIEMGNPELRAAKAWNFSLSLDQKLGQQTTLTMHGFFIDLRDLVELKFMGIDDRFSYRILQPVNIDEAVLYGASFEFQTHMGNRLGIPVQLWGNYSWNGSTVTDPLSLENRRINDQPVHILKLHADYLWSAINTRFSAGYYYTSKRVTANSYQEDGSFFPGFFIEEFGQIDASVKYYFRKWGSVSFSIHNLGNSNEVLHQAGVKEQLEFGRLYRLGMELDF